MSPFSLKLILRPFILCANMSQILRSIVHKCLYDIPSGGSGSFMSSLKWYSFKSILLLTKILSLTRSLKGESPLRKLIAPTVSLRQEYPSCGRVLTIWKWRKKSAVKSQSDEQKLHIRHKYTGWVSKAKQNPMLSEAYGVNAAGIWEERTQAYSRRSLSMLWRWTSKQQPVQRCVVELSEVIMQMTIMYKILILQR